MAGSTTEALGIFQSDIIIRGALVAGIRDLRLNTWKLRTVFASLLYDETTSNDYGQNEVARATEWFMNTDIPVIMAYRTEQPPLPCISIALQSSQEDKNTLADVHYVPSETQGERWPALTAPITNYTYDRVTGVVTVPDLRLIVIQGQVVVTRSGRRYPVLEVIDRTTFRIQPKLTVNLDGFVIKGQEPGDVVTMESASFREQYLIGCHVTAEAVHLTYLHSIITFILLHYRQQYLEARGFGESFINSTDFKRNEYLETDLVYSRYISITGNVRQYWPKAILTPITQISTQTTSTNDTSNSNSNLYPDVDLDADALSGFIFN